MGDWSIIELSAQNRIEELEEENSKLKEQVKKLRKILSPIKCRVCDRRIIRGEMYWHMADGSVCDSCHDDVIDSDRIE